MSTSLSQIVIKVVVFGRVQGVGFRIFTYRAARELGITGYVRNRIDGSVESVLEGPPDKIAKMKLKLAQGPAFAEVSDISEEILSGVELHTGFLILD